MQRLGVPICFSLLIARSAPAFAGPDDCGSPRRLRGIDVSDDGEEPEVVRGRLMRWLKRVERRARRRPIIYTAPKMSDILGEQFRDYLLWVAHYEVDCPTVPGGWSRWTFWQHSKSGRVDGITGDVDLDAFAGTIAQLRKLKRPSR